MSLSRGGPGLRVLGCLGSPSAATAPLGKGPAGHPGQVSGVTLRSHSLGGQLRP